MPRPSPHTADLGRAIGCDYIKTPRALVVVEPGGCLSRIDLSSQNYTVLGRGYSELEDVLLSTDGSGAYLTEREGSVYRVELDRADRVHAKLICRGLLTPHFLALNEANGHAYMVEHGYPGRLLRVNLDSGREEVLADDLQGATGLKLSKGLRLAYFREGRGGGEGRVSRLDLETGRRQMMVTDIRSPFYLTWVDPAETVRARRAGGHAA